MGSAKKHRLGFTLIEVLLSMIILSMIAIMGSYAYSFFATNWQRSELFFQQSQQQYLEDILIERTLLHTFPKPVLRLDAAMTFYFLGRDEGYTAYSTRSVKNPSVPAVYRLFREIAPDGGWNLVYQEALLDDVILSASEQQLQFDNKIILKKNLTQLSFNYYVPVKTENFDEASTLVLHWTSSYDSENSVENPRKINISFDQTTWLIDLPDVTGYLLSSGGAYD